jgi:hypothetical protein
MGPEQAVLMEGYRRLVLVPGHAVWDLQGDPAEDSSWFLKPYQNREPRYFIEHIRAGVEAAAGDSGSLLLFSGGATEAAAGPRTEAVGYWLIAGRYGWWGHAGVRGRAFTEEYALDSFENVLHGIQRFRQIAGWWPERITVCGWGFKRRRVAELHRAALAWRRPFDYISVNEPVNLEEARLREQTTCAEFEADPYGSRPPLSTKRLARAHFSRVAPYAVTDPAGWTGPFPWE